MAAAAVRCDETLLRQPECEYLSIHPYFLGLCRDAQVSVTCSANPRFSGTSLSEINIE